MAVKRTQMALFGRGDDLPLFTRVPDDAPKHVGFEGLVRELKAKGYTEEQARRIAASTARNASAAAKRRNPRLRRVAGA